MRVPPSTIAASFQEPLPCYVYRAASHRNPARHNCGAPMVGLVQGSGEAQPQGRPFQ